MLKGVIFDLDGVITDTAKYHYIAWKNSAKRLGIDIDEEFNEKLKGISRVDSLKKILEYGGKTNDISDEEFDRILVEKNEEYLKLLENLSKKDILEGIEDFIKEIKENNLSIGIASASKNAKAILDKLELLPMIDYIVDSSTIKNGKPAPDIFLEAAKGLGLSIDEVVGVEDSEAGIESMKVGKIKSIGIGVVGDITLESTSQLGLKKLNLI